MGNARVLVIDEEEAMVETIGHALQEAGITYKNSVKFSEWASILKSECIDVTLMAMSLTEMEARELYYFLKQHRPLSQIFLLVDNASTMDIIELLEAGAADFFSSKSMDAAEIAEAVRIALSKADRWRKCFGYSKRQS